MDKQKSRIKNLKTRAKVSKEEYVENSNIICEKLLPYLDKKKNIGLYMSIQNEIDVSSLLFLNYNFFLPKVRNSEDMDFMLLDDINSLKVGPFDILEPTSNIIIEPKDLDLIIVPLVGFDTDKNRIGQGKGYYDRYLSKTDCLKIGIAYDFQKVGHIKAEEHDIPLDLIITEKHIYK